jgi:hypothetical protein
MLTRAKPIMKPLGLNAIGKPYSSSFDPGYRLKHKPSYAHLRGKRRPKPKESAAATLSWKENTRKAEFTARAPTGGSYILSPFLHCWNVDFREKVGTRSKGPRQQLGFAHTLDEAKAIAEADSARLANGGAT